MLRRTMRSRASQGGIHESSHAAGKMKNDSTCCLEGLDGMQHGADQEKCHLLSPVYYINELVCKPATDKALHIHSAGKHLGRRRMRRYQFCSIVVTKRLQTTGLKAKKRHIFSHKMNGRKAGTIFTIVLCGSNIQNIQISMKNTTLLLKHVTL